MKKIIYLSVLAGSLMTLGACDESEYEIDNLFPEKYHKILYVNNSGMKEVTLYNTEEETYTFSLIKAGSDPKLTAVADVRAMTQAEMDEAYSELQGVNYQVIPTTAYALGRNPGDTHFEFASSDLYKLMDIVLNPGAVKTLIESNPDAVWVLPLVVESPNDSINTLKKELILKFMAVVTPSVSFPNTKLSKEYTLGKETKAVEIPVLFALDVDNKWEINCEFGLDAAYIDTYNAANGTTYQILPEGMYSFAESMELNTPNKQLNLNVTVNVHQLPAGDYMLPIRLKSVSQFIVSPTAGLCAMAIRIMSPVLDRKDWTVTANTEEIGGEGPVNGRVGCLLDGDVNTFWHSQWNGSTKELPHELIFDTKKEHTFTQFGIISRQGTYYVKAGEFYVSSDNKEWVKVGNFAMTKDPSQQIYSVKSTKGRYFKVLITESYNNPHSALAEVYAYGQ